MKNFVAVRSWTEKEQYGRHFSAEFTYVKEGETEKHSSGECEQKPNTEEDRNGTEQVCIACLKVDLEEKENLSRQHLPNIKDKRMPAHAAESLKQLLFESRSIFALD